MLKVLKLYHYYPLFDLKFTILNEDESVFCLYSFLSFIQLCFINVVLYICMYVCMYVCARVRVS